MEEITEWLHLQSYSPNRRYDVRLCYVLDDRALLTVTLEDDVGDLNFGILFESEGRPQYFSDWAGECTSKFECYLRESVSEEPYIGIVSLISGLVKHIGRLQDLIRRENRFDLYGSSTKTRQSDDDTINEINQTDVVSKSYDNRYLCGRLLRGGIGFDFKVIPCGKVWRLSINNIIFLVDISSLETGGPIICVEQPYIISNYVRHSGLVVIPGLTPYNWEPSKIERLVEKLYSLTRSAVIGFDKYQIDLLDLHFKQLLDVPVNFDEYVVEVVRSDQYGCRVPSRLFNEARKYDSIVGVCITNEAGQKTYSSILSSRSDDDRIEISDKIAEDLGLVNDDIVNIELVLPQPVRRIEIRDDSENFSKDPEHDDLIKDSLSNYPLITEGNRIVVGNQTVTIIRLDPPGYSTIVRSDDNDTAQLIYHNSSYVR